MERRQLTIRSTNPRISAFTNPLRWCVALFCLVALPTCSGGSRADLASAKQALVANEYEKAAVKGDAAAMDHLAAPYVSGRGVPKDFQRAMTWYQKAASKRDGTAMVEIAMLYYRGQGVPQDGAQAMQWLRKAADQTHSAYAMRKLGDAYSDGTLIKPDDQLALSWYTKAAWGGDAPAMVDLGWMYLDGKHISRDYLSARTWFQRAANKGAPDAALGLGIIYHYGAGVDPDDRLAFSFLQQAAFRGNVEAMRYLGSLYYADHNFTAALSWYRRAAEKGDGFAMENVYVIYQNGVGVPKDQSVAQKWLEKAAASGDEKASAVLEQEIQNSPEGTARSP